MRKLKQASFFVWNTLLATKKRRGYNTYWENLEHMKTILFGAATDLGVSRDGASLGPAVILNDVKDFYDGEKELLEADPSFIKSRDPKDLRKNEEVLKEYNVNLYHHILAKIQDGYFPVMLGGDHSAAISSALASAKVHKEIGIIWVDAHTDYNTYETTETGNIHGLPLASITGYKTEELREFFDGKTISPSHTVVVGARSVDKEEWVNVRDAGITVISTEEVKQRGIENVMDEAFRIAGNGTNGIHVSYDLDVIDPIVAPGVTVPEENGISREEALQVAEYLSNHIDQVQSFDLVELNPTKDIEKKTEIIAVEILSKVLKAIQNK